MMQRLRTANVVWRGTRWASSTVAHGNGFDDEELISLIKAYPVHSNATPYEIMNVSYHTFDTKQLKANFNKYAKIYHPDIRHEHPLLQDRAERFHKVMNAYKLLKNQRAKTMYDQYKVGWDDNRDYVTSDSAAEFNNGMAFRSANFKAYQYYSAGTWEDYQEMKNSQSRTMDLEKNKYQIAGYVVAVMVVAFIVESIGLNELSDQEIALRAAVSRQSNQDLQKAYNNYGMGDGKEDRINRFLWWRRLTDVLHSYDSYD